MIKKYVFVSGPLFSSGLATENTRNAMQVGLGLRELDPDIVPIIPHLNIHMEMAFPKQEAYWIKYDLDLLERCDAIIRLPGISIHGDKEVEHAKKLGLFHYRLEKLDELEQFVEQLDVYLHETR